MGGGESREELEAVWDPEMNTDKKAGNLGHGKGGIEDP